MPREGATGKMNEYDAQVVARFANSTLTWKMLIYRSDAKDSPRKDHVSVGFQMLLIQYCQEY